MIVGVDFDNTLVCYDGLFHQHAVAAGWVSPATGVDKTAVRDAMRQQGMEEAWVTLQGRVYGQAIEQAPAFPGVHAFFKACHDAGITLCIISHKTRQPASCEAFDLIAAARRWLTSHKLMQPAMAAGALPASQVYFEPTKQAKISRIVSLGCDHFIDDLPEFLAALSHAQPRCRRWLFDPRHRHGAPAGDVTSLRSWHDALAQVVGLQETAMAKGASDA